MPHFIQVIGDLILFALSPPEDITPPREDQIIPLKLLVLILKLYFHIYATLSLRPPP